MIFGSGTRLSIQPRECTVLPSVLCLKSLIVHPCAMLTYVHLGHLTRGNGFPWKRAVAPDSEHLGKAKGNTALKSLGELGRDSPLCPGMTQASRLLCERALLGLECRCFLSETMGRADRDLLVMPVSECVCCRQSHFWKGNGALGETK